ncbi:MAG: hypothetical protein Q8P20_03665 [bacterium]|nr:hypothetical protein [bacterium]
MNNRKGFISIVTAIVIAVLAVGFAGIAVYYETQKDETTSSATKITTTNTTTNTNLVVNTNTVVDKTDDWLTYTNDSYKFSIKYPNSCPFDEADYVTDSEYYPQLFYSMYCNGFSGEAFFIEVHNNENELTLDDYIPINKRLNIEGTEEWSSTLVNGHEGRQYLDINGVSITLIIPVDKFVYQIISQDNSNIFQTALSTFQFTDDTNDGNHTTVSGHSFQYPSSWLFQQKENFQWTYEIAAFTENDSSIASLQCPPPEIGYELWDFENSTRSYLYNEELYGAKLRIGKPSIERAGSTDVGNRYLIFMYKGEEEHQDSVCQLSILDYNGSLESIATDIFNSISQN